MPFPGVDDGPALRAEQGYQSGHGRHDRLEAGDVVAKGVAEAAGLDEIALHVDDDQRHLAGREGEGKGLGVDGDHLCLRHRQCPAMARPIEVRSASAAGTT